MKIKELISGDVKNMTLLELVEKIGNDKFEKLKIGRAVQQGMPRPISASRNAETDL